MIVINASKKINNNNNYNNKYIQSNQTTIIKKKMLSLSKVELGDFLKIKNNLLEQVFNYYHKPFYNEAIYLYSGTMFEQINQEALNNNNYLVNNVYIFSALYGIINAVDVIQSYRLDFTKSNIFEQSLYNYWKEYVNDMINSHPSKQLLILSSNEYTKLIDFKTINKEYFSLEFINIKNSYERKKIRGLILNYCILNYINEYNNLDSVIISLYVFKIEKNKILISKL